MPRPAYPLTILEFQERFGTEDACREYLFASRWPDGFVCPKCDGSSSGAQTRRNLWVCKDCGHQTSVTAGTTLHGTRLPLRTWFWAAYLVSTHHPGISALQLQRQLGIGCHETAWAMLHKLRSAMVAPERELLSGEVEVDEFFLGGYQPGLKGGRQRGKKALVGAAIEVRGRGSGRLRLAALPGSSRDALGAFAQATTQDGAIVHTDGLNTYRVLTELGYQHLPHTQLNAATGEQLLPRVHRAVSNLKAWMHGTHRHVSAEHLPAYLDEYVFRHNRRCTPMAAFQTLLGLSAQHEPLTYRQIINRAS